MSDSGSISAYYAPPDLLARIEQALRAAGIDPAAPGYLNLTRCDQFHLGGLAQTRSMAAAAGVVPGCRVLDVGCGIGGSARVLAAEFGAAVAAVDAVREFVDTARLLTERAGLSDRIAYEQALVPPFDQPSESYDLIWVQLALMNIADKQQFFAECRRLLKPGGRLALLDIVRGESTGDLHFPVLWADRPELSHLLTDAAFARLLAETGFAIDDLADFTGPALAWIDSVRWERQRQTEAERAMSTALLIPGDAAAKSANVRRNLVEGRIGVRQLLAHARG